MKLERLALWDEKYLFTEQGETEKGFIGWLKGNFNEDRLVLSDMVMTGDNDYMIRYELESLCIFLASEGRAANWRRRQYCRKRNRRIC